MSARNTFAATRRSHAILKKLRRGEGVTIRQVSDEFGIQYPQARADLKLLEELYDLNTLRDGRIKVWEMPGAGDPKTHVGIAAALELGGVALDIFKDTPYGEAIDGLAQEWHTKVRKSARGRLQRLSSGLVLRRTWAPRNRRHTLEVLEGFLDAIQLRRGVYISYERSDGDVGDYLIIPRRLIWYQDRLWLQAVHDDTQKLFDVAGVKKTELVAQQELIKELATRLVASGEFVADDDRDEALQVAVPADGEDSDGGDEGAESGESEEPDGPESIYARAVEAVTARVKEWFEYGSREEEDAYFADSFGIFATNFEPQNVVLVVRDSWANYLRRYKVHPSQQIEETDDGLKVEFDIGICPEFKSFILGMSPSVEVKEPKALREDLKERAQSWLD